VVFFTPKGRALFGAPPVNPEPGRLRTVGDPGDTGELDPPTIDAPAAIPRWKRDADIPWEVEARVWEALDPA
jgi:hypothetical protein